MKSIITVFIALSLTACTSLQPIELSKHEFQNSLSTSNQLVVGDEVLITTSNNIKYEFEVTKITNSHIISSGHLFASDISIPISDIKFIKKEVFSWWKTSALSLFLLSTVAIVPPCACEPPVAIY